ncbi:MAG: M23 family metallopeptidase [Muribaculaceae bacterium]|nr:M23 family metallopeptidase [Muribaculaceae bacterium]
MNLKRHFRIRIEDESHLTEVGSMRISLVGLTGIIIGLTLAAIALGACIIYLTPLRAMLPGYLKANQRVATEEGLLRLDSLMDAYKVNQAYIDNFIRVTDTSRTPTDSAAITPVNRELVSDSLMKPGAAEQRFVSQMEERERYNISVLAPLAADGVIFSPVASEGVFAESTHQSDEGIVLMTADAAVQCAADGSVVALYHSNSEGGYVIVAQHSRGFLTSYSGVGTPLVGVGDNVSAGQVIALSPNPDSKGIRDFTIRMWHNGLPVHPYDYVAAPEINTRRTATLPYEAPRGK